MNEEKYAELVRKVYAAYEAKTPKSKQLYDRACNTFQDGVSRSGGWIKPYAFYCTHAKGTRMWDVDGNEYVDCLCGAGALNLGHNHPEVIEAVRREIEKGLLIHNPDFGIEGAELFREVVPCAEKIRYRNSGTEVVMSALQVGRVYSGRDKILKFYGALHGEEPATSYGWVRYSREPVTGGIPREFFSLTTEVLPNDIDAVRRKLDEDPEIGVVLTDVICAPAGLQLPTAEYLRELRQITKEQGVVLIFDEVVTGFRMALGGAQEYYGVTPDLATYGKAVAGGGKIAVLAGTNEVMQALAIQKEAESIFAVTGKKPVFQSGTMCDATPGVAALGATMKVLKKFNTEGGYKKLLERTVRIASGFGDAFKKRGIPYCEHHIPSLFYYFLGDEDPNTFEKYAHHDGRLAYTFGVSLLPEGVLLGLFHPGMVMVSFVLTDEDEDRILSAVNASLDKYNWAEVYHS